MQPVTLPTKRHHFAGWQYRWVSIWHWALLEVRYSLYSTSIAFDLHVRCAQSVFILSFIRKEQTEISTQCFKTGHMQEAMSETLLLNLAFMEALTIYGLVVALAIFIYLFILFANPFD